MLPLDKVSQSSTDIDSVLPKGIYETKVTRITPEGETALEGPLEGNFSEIGNSKIIFYILFVYFFEIANP